MSKRPSQFETARTRGNRLYARLHSEILTGGLRPGEALSETRVAEQHGMSRTPVREVFQNLAKEGLLRIVPQIGTFIAPINLASVNAGQFIREALECRAVRDAARHASRQQVATLKEQIAAQAKAIRAGDHFAFFALDEIMHRLILEVSGHAGVWDLIASVKAQLDRVRYLSLEEQAWLTMIFRQHREIVAAIAAHDPVQAEGAMQQHLRTVFAAIERIASAHAEFFEDDILELNEKSA
jgi:GntR family transcriptional regulator, rspAB operon transcriptional repressor